MSGTRRRPIAALALIAVLALIAGIMLGSGSGTSERGGASPEINRKFLSADLDVERWVGVFEGESREVYRSREAVVRSLALAPGMNVADVGAGTGLFTVLFAHAVGATGGVYAVDISPKFLEHLRSRAATSGLDQVHVVEGSDRSVRLEPDSLDLVFVCDTYHHFEYPGETLASIHAALRSDGSLVVVDFERIPDVTEQWILEHVRADKQAFTREIEAADFVLDSELEIEGLSDNYALRFRKRATPGD